MDNIEILEVSQRYGRLRLHVRFNYPDGSQQEMVWKTDPRRSDEEIEDILKRRYEQMRPNKIRALEESTKEREKKIKKRMKKFKG